MAPNPTLHPVIRLIMHIAHGDEILLVGGVVAITMIIAVVANMEIPQ